MTEGKTVWTDQQVEQVVGNLLRAGVLLAAAVVVAGAGVYLACHGTEPADHHVFHGETEELSSPLGIVRDALTLRGAG